LRKPSPRTAARAQHLRCVGTAAALRNAQMHQIGAQKSSSNLLLINDLNQRTMLRPSRNDYSIANKANERAFCPIR